MCLMMLFLSLMSCCLLKRKCQRWRPCALYKGRVWTSQEGVDALNNMKEVCQSLRVLLWVSAWQWQNEIISWDIVAPWKGHKRAVLLRVQFGDNLVVASFFIRTFWVPLCCILYFVSYQVIFFMIWRGKQQSKLSSAIPISSLLMVV